MAVSADKLDGIRSKIDWSRKHVANIEVEVRMFFETQPYKIEVRRDPQSRRVIYYVAAVADVPASLCQIVGDALGNMISVLDHLAYRLFLKGGTSGDGRHVYFPITKNATNRVDYETERKRKVKDIPGPIVAALDALEPFKGGKGNTLWVLNELNNLSKHRELLVVGSSFRSVDIGTQMSSVFQKQTGMPFPNVSLFLKPEDKLFPLKVGDELFVDSPDAEVNAKMRFKLELSLNEPQIIKAAPLVEISNEFLGLVESIVHQFAIFL